MLRCFAWGCLRGMVWLLNHRFCSGPYRKMDSGRNHWATPTFLSSISSQPFCSFPSHVSSCFQQAMKQQLPHLSGWSLWKIVRWRPSLPLAKPHLSQSLLSTSFIVICIPLPTSVLLSHCMQSIFQGCPHPKPVVSSCGFLFLCVLFPTPHFSSVRNVPFTIPTVTIPTIHTKLFQNEVWPWLLSIEQLSCWCPSYWTCGHVQSWTELQ